jgi:hypothetical protein
MKRSELFKLGLAAAGVALVGTRQALADSPAARFLSNTGDPAVHAENDYKSGPAVSAIATEYIAIGATNQSDTYPAIVGTGGPVGVEGQGYDRGTLKGTGVVGLGTIGVQGTGAIGLQGSGTGTGIQGSGPTGVKGTGAIGGSFQGSHSNIRLTPTQKTHPKTGHVGDLIVDTTGHLWFYGAKGWVQLA